jgi:hypothetical protein
VTLSIRPIMNSAVEEIFAFKTCCGIGVFDQNLEIQITNRGTEPVQIPAYFDLTDRAGVHRIETVMPQGVLSLEPGETKAFYCSMDEGRWESAQEIVLYDVEGNSYSVEVT